MSSSTHSIGNSGESRACTHMINLGFKILERNWRYRHEEIDIIAENESFIVFVEVKTRKNNLYGRPETFVNRKKQNHMIRAANEYLIKKNLDKEARFDIIAVTGLGDDGEVVHFPNAFYPIL